MPLYHGTIGHIEKEGLYGYRTDFRVFQRLCFRKKPNGKFQLARIYGAYEREKEEIEKNKAINEKLKDEHRRYIIHRITDDMAIVEYPDENWFAPTVNDRISNNVYDSFDKALIALVAFKADNIRAAEYIFKMLGM